MKSSERKRQFLWSACGSGPTPITVGAYLNKGVPNIIRLAKWQGPVRFGHESVKPLELLELRQCLLDKGSQQESHSVAGTF